MDIEEWNRIKNISKLNGSLNPADLTQSLENIKQYREANRDKLIAYSKVKNKQYYLEHKEELSEKRKLQRKLIKLSRDIEV